MLFFSYFFSSSSLFCICCFFTAKLCVYLVWKIAWNCYKGFPSFVSLFVPSFILSELFFFVLFLLLLPPTLFLLLLFSIPQSQHKHLHNSNRKNVSPFYAIAVQSTSNIRYNNLFTFDMFLWLCAHSYFSKTVLNYSDILTLCLLE